MSEYYVIEGKDKILYVVDEKEKEKLCVDNNRFLKISDDKTNILGKHIKDICIGMENIYGEENCLDSLIIKNNKQIDSGLAGKIYEACCNGNCNYIAKIQSGSSDDEIKIQNIMAELNIAPKILKAYNCFDKSIIIMEALDTTLDVFLVSSTPGQNERRKKNIEKIISNPDINLLIEKLEKADTGNYKKQSYIFNVAMARENLLNKLEELIGRELAIKLMYDDKLSIDLKRLAIKDIMNKIYIMNKNGIYHHDLHLKNIMVNKSRKYFYIIDFGDSNNIKPAIGSDYEVLLSSFYKLINQYNLRYLNANYGKYIAGKIRIMKRKLG